MQPYFYPFIGYFQIIANTDLFILLDDVQYIRHGWVNRNRILKPGGGWQYITVPLQQHHQKTDIKDILPKLNDDWKELILRQTDHYRKRAPFFHEVVDLLKESLYSDFRNITELNRNGIAGVCSYVGLDCNVKISSELNLNYSEIHDSGDWALQICRQLGAASYINPPGGMELFDKLKFDKAGIDLKFQVLPDFQYSQRTGKPFEDKLSMLDVLMFNSPADVMLLLKSIKLGTRNSEVRSE